MRTPIENAAIANLFGEVRPVEPQVKPVAQLRDEAKRDAKREVILPPVNKEEADAAAYEAAHTLRLVHDWMVEAEFGNAAEQVAGYCHIHGVHKTIRYAFALSRFASAFMRETERIPTYQIALAELLGTYSPELAAYVESRNREKATENVTFSATATAMDASEIKVFDEQEASF